MSRKQSLQEMLRALPKPAPRNDWNRGRPGALAPDDGFPAYDPRDFESDHGSKGGSDEEEEEEEEEEDAGDGAAGGAYAVLAALEGADDGDDGWATVGSKQKRKTPAAQQASQGRAQATAGGQGQRAQQQQQQQQRAQQQQQQLQRSPAPRGPRPVTHDEQGKPLTDDYYKTFQKAYRNPQTGMCCLRFHKTDIIAVAPTGDVTVTSGGYRTRTTFQSLREGLAPLGIKLASQGYEGNGAWYVQLPDGTSLDFQDGLVIRAAGPGDMRRGAALLSALAGPDGGAAAAVRVASGAGPSTSTGSTARLAPHAGQQRTGQPGPSTSPVYAYHPTAARPVYTPQGMQYAPAGAQSPSTSSQAAASTSAYRGAAAAGPSGAGTSSSAQHKPAVDMNRLFTDALALHEADEPLDDEHACILCMGALRSTILVPCGHMILCDTCSKDVMGRTAECPMCRTKVTQVVTVA